MSFKKIVFKDEQGNALNIIPDAVAIHIIEVNEETGAETIIRKLEDESWGVNGTSNESGTKFIGTTDGSDFVVKANGKKLAEFSADGAINIFSEPGKPISINSKGDIILNASEGEGKIYMKGETIDQ